MLQDLPVWLAHFRAQAAHPRQLPATLDDTLTSRERRLIAASIATFQLGESSAGAQLRRAVRRYCQARQDDTYAEIFDLFIAEEQRHASLLREFMQDHGIALCERAFTDEAFRALRRLGGLEARLRILVSAELVGIVYYRALEVVTDCRRLQILCRSLVADELAHVAFESQLLLALKGEKGGCTKFLLGAWEQGLLTGAALVVWAMHRRVLKSAGYGPLLFLRDCRAQYCFYLQWPAAPRSNRQRRPHQHLSPHGS
jgi:rubrerythrin